MGAGASAGVSAVIENSNKDDLKAALGNLGSEERKKLLKTMETTKPTPRAGANPFASLNLGADCDELIKKCADTDASSLNKSNIEFSRLSQKVATMLAPAFKDKIPDLVALHETLAKGFKGKENKPPYCAVEGALFASNAVKFSSIKDAGHVVIATPFYKEFERGSPATAENPNGEDSPIQKFEELVFLLGFNKNITAELIFVNDSVGAEKTDSLPACADGGSTKLFKDSLKAYTSAKGIAIDLSGEDQVDGFESFTALGGQLKVTFTSVEKEAVKGSSCESPEEKRKRLENRGGDGKLRERKGGAVLSGLEIPLPEGKDALRTVRVMLDGDSTIGVAAFMGDACYSILQAGDTGYLSNLKHECTAISMAAADGGGAGAADDATQARVLNRKLFFSGFTVPLLFPELTSKYKFKGTTQLPAKAFRGDVNFTEAKLPTVQPNVDLGLLALLCSTLNKQGGTIGSGPIALRDNVASSTMTSSDLNAEWTKTYGPIFTSAVTLCRNLKADECAALPAWITGFLEGMKLEHYATLFGNEKSADVDALFKEMANFRDASDRNAVLDKLKETFKKLFPNDVA